MCFYSSNFNMLFENVIQQNNYYKAHVPNHIIMCCIKIMLIDILSYLHACMHTCMQCRLQSICYLWYTTVCYVGTLCTFLFGQFCYLQTAQVHLAV